MERFIPHSQIVEVQQLTDIVELIGGYLPLKKAGANYRTLCPFHEEKTPSFTVNPQKQIFHCFGCHKGGNVFTFVTAYEKVSFPEAVRMLAERRGIKLSSYGIKDDATREKRIDLLKTNRQVANYYHRQLLESKQGEIARQYLAKRGFSAAMTARFLLGYAPDGWDNLIRYAKENVIQLKYLEELGLIVSRKEKEGFYDSFRNRLMFPIFNLRDGVVGFGGRALADAEPVYLNSPETILFNKGKSLYGFNFAKEAASRIGKLCIVEGYTDVIMAHQFGFEWVVATLGTALTTEHIKSIRRFVDKVVIIYDADVAGEKASARSLNLFLPEEIDLFVARLPESLDPYDCLVQKDGTVLFQKCLDGAIELFTYRLEIIRRKYDLDKVEEKVKAIDEILETISAIPNVIRRNLYLRQLSETVNVPEEILHNRLRARMKRTYQEPNITEATTEAVLLPSQQQDIKAGEQVIEIMLSKNEFIPIIKRSVRLDDYPSRESRRLAEKIFENYEREGEVTIEGLLNYLADDSELSSIAVRISDEASKKKINDPDRYLRDWLSFIDKRKKQNEIPSLKRELREKKGTPDEDEILLKLQLNKAATSLK
jgi:DNA primase